MVVIEMTLRSLIRSTAITDRRKVSREITRLASFDDRLRIGDCGRFFGPDTCFFEFHPVFLLSLYAHAFPLICDRIVVSSGINRVRVIIIQFERFDFANVFGGRRVGEVRNTMFVNPTMNRRRWR